MLKQLWDYIFLVRTSIDEWKTTAWKDIDVENMDMECKKFSKVSSQMIGVINRFHGNSDSDFTTFSMAFLDLSGSSPL